MSSPTVYLVSGANRGLGLGLVTALVQRPDTIVFAGARDPPNATDLNALAAAHAGKLHVVKLVSADTESNTAAAAQIAKVADHIDVVIANAAVGDVFADALTASKEEMTRHFDVGGLFAS